MTTALSPDDLGEVGESLFRKLCAQAQLTCNKADRDRTGWDFRVEFPMGGEPSETLDQRSPRVCQIQLKSTAGESGTRINARLSAIERLAKDGAPAAIVVFRMRADGTELMGYVIHLLGEELAKVLLRLRRAESEGRTDINHMTISFDYRKGRRFKPDADGLRTALSEVSPVDVDAYAEEKRDQLAKSRLSRGRRHRSRGFDLARKPRPSNQNLVWVRASATAEAPGLRSPVWHTRSLPEDYARWH
jgi:hypothetical protein